MDKKIAIFIFEIAIFLIVIGPTAVNYRQTFLKSVKAI